MIEKFIHTHVVKNFNSVQVHLQDDIEKFYCIQLTKDKKGVEVVSQFCANNFEELISQINKKTPVILNFTGRKIITNTITSKVDYKEKLLFNKDPNSFYINKIEKSDQVLISIARKNEIDISLQKFTEAGFDIIDFSIGAITFENLRSLVPSKESIVTSLYAYNFILNTVEVSNHENGELHDLSVASEVIKNSHILAFSAFLAYLNPSLASKNFEEILNIRKESFIYKKAFNFTGFIFGTLLLSLLISSFILQKIYANKNLDIQYELTTHNNIQNSIEKLKKDKLYKENILRNTSFGSGNYISDYLSQMLESVPEDIILEELEVFPITEELQEGKNAAFRSKSIIVKGVTPTQFSVNDWIKTLNKLQWIKKTEVKNYELKKDNVQFILQIYI